MKFLKKKNRHYLAMWDMYGLECIFDMTAYNEQREQWHKEEVWSVLKDENHKSVEPKGPPLSMMILRARVNSQRRYEIYEFMSDFNLEKIKTLFKSDPNFIVEFVRENGIKIYSDYEKHSKQCIF